MGKNNLDTLVLTRIIDAPREAVFKAWTDPERMKRWWGPKGFTLPFCKIDLRVGGVVHYCMRSPEGRDYWGKGIYREIVGPERIVMTDLFSDEQGNSVPPTQHGLSDEWPSEALISVTLEDLDGKTKLTLQHGEIPKSGPEREMCEEGWGQTLDRLAEEAAAGL